MPAFDLEYWQRWQKNSGGNAESKRKRKDAVEKRQTANPAGKSSSSKLRVANAGVKRGRGVVFTSEKQRPDYPACTSADEFLPRGRSYKAPLTLAGGAIGQAKREFSDLAEAMLKPGPGEYGGTDWSSFGAQPESTKRSTHGSKIPRAKRANLFRQEQAGGTVAYDDGNGFVKLKAAVEAHSFPRSSRTSPELERELNSEV